MSRAAVSKRRERANMALFLGPACIILLGFFIAPAVVDVGIAFTDMGQNIRVTTVTLENVRRIFLSDSQLPKVLSVTTLYVVGTLALFNVGFALVMALTTTSVSQPTGALFRGIWLLPRFSPSVVYALLWVWVVDASDFGLLNQMLHAVGLAPFDMRDQAPIALIIIANGFIGTGTGMIILTSSIRAIPEHLFHAARVDGAGGFAITRFVVLPALRWPLSFITIFQALSLLTSFEYIWLITNGGPFYDTTVYALMVYKRAFQNGQYAYGAALALILIVIGIVVTLVSWRLLDLRSLLQRPRIEVQ
ncbi:MAG TPA: sugar ABC transporter permease [Bauldia sp.]|nr:sugar ABC transporter permease [Bauldia sp.]